MGPWDAFAGSGCPTFRRWPSAQPTVPPQTGRRTAVDERSDIYGLGIIFYEMLTGKKPFLGSDAMSIILKHAKAPVPVLPHRLSQYQALINMLLAKSPENRLQSADEVLAWL